MHILVYMYVFIYRKLESFFFLNCFNAIYIHRKKKEKKKKGLTGLIASEAENVKSNHLW